LDETKHEMLNLIPKESSSINFLFNFFSPLKVYVYQSNEETYLTRIISLSTLPIQYTFPFYFIKKSQFDSN